MAADKVEGPATVITFLGIRVDTVRIELTLPSDKLECIGDLVRSWQGHRSGQRVDFESLLGHLSHAATIIQQGRVFLRHLYDIQARTGSPYYHVHLDAEAQADLLWWEQFLQTWNGIMFFRQPPIPAVYVYTDASGSFGADGLWVPHLCFQLQWPTTWSAVDIVDKELVPVVVAAALWGGQWHHSHVCFHIDNEAVVAILHRQSGRSMIDRHLLRCFYFYSAFYQFHFTVEHIPGVLNRAADALSRDNITLFSSLFPQASQAHFPPSVMDMLVTQQPNWGSTAWISLFTGTLTHP